MACDHRFLNLLNPVGKFKYLFIGTFNPSWNFGNADQADYFYGRGRNYFWTILPAVFNQPDLKNSPFGVKLDFLQNFEIGITDLVRTVQNADINNPIDVANLTNGFSDEVLSTYELSFNTNVILDFINNNSETLQGVFLTRSTLNGIHQIAAEWSLVQQNCLECGINCEKLITPSRFVNQQKIDSWIIAVNP